MNKIKQLLSATCLGAVLLFSACQKELPKSEIMSSATAGTVTPSATSIVLSKAKNNGGDTSLVLNVSKANYGSSVAVTNVLQIDSMGDNWKNPQSITLNAGMMSQAISTPDLNTLLLKLHLPAAKASQVQVRLMNTVSASVAPVYSAPVTLTVTPYSIASYVYVPGAYQGWSPSSADSLVSASGNNIYVGVINFTGSDYNFKITNERDWNGMAYGSGSGAGTVSTTGGNLVAPGDGGYLISLNLANNTITFAPQWSIIGDASPGGWSSDTNMDFDKINNVWYITTTLVSDGTKAIKFRFGNDWTVNLGGSNGTLTQGGGNLTIPATKPAGDIYKITLNVMANTYTLVKQ